MQSQNTVGALRAFLGKNPEKRPDIVAFVQAGDANIPRWLKGNGPVGLYLIRLRVYLTERGTKPVEWAHLDDRLIMLARIISRDTLTIKEAAGQIGTVEQNLLSTLLGKRGFSGEKLESVQALNELYGSALEPLKAPVVTGASSPRQIVIGERITLDQNAALQLLASGIALIVPIAEYLASDQCSAEQRNLFRKQVGSKTLFDATTALNALTSETSRSLMRARQ